MYTDVFCDLFHILCYFVYIQVCGLMIIKGVVVDEENEVGT